MSLPLPTELWRNIFLFLNSNLSVYVLFAISSFDSTHVCRCLQTAIESVCELTGFDSTHVCRCLQTWTRCTLSRSSLIVPTFVGVCKHYIFGEVERARLIVPTFVGVCKQGVKKPTLYGTFGEYFFVKNFSFGRSNQPLLTAFSLPLQ